MLPFKRILFPVDFSDTASEATVGAARYVEAFVGRYEADVTLLHVVEPPRYNDVRLPASPDQERARLARYLTKELEYVRVERVLAYGDAAEKILETARERHADLIMMPTHGEGPFRRFLLGSVTAKVLHDADCPVWTGVHLEKAPPLEKIEFRRFLCALDRHEYSKTVLAAAMELAEEYRACLNVVHVASSAEDVEPTRRAICEVAPGAYVVVEPGEIPEVVAAVAERTSADLLVIGRNPAPGVLGRLRKHSYPIIRQSPCPVISV